MFRRRINQLLVAVVSFVMWKYINKTYQVDDIVLYKNMMAIVDPNRAPTLT